MRITGWGVEYDVEPIKTKYTNGNLAVILVCKNGEPYGNLTTNLGDKLPEDLAWVDTNNIPDAERFIEENNLGEYTGMVKPSGFCVYPQYKFY